MAYQELSIYGTPARLMTSDQLTPKQIAVYSGQWSDSLASSEFNTPVDAPDLAVYMEAGRAVVLLGEQKELFAQAYFTLPKNGLSIVGGWYSSLRGAGGIVMQATARHAMKTDGVEKAHAHVREGNSRAIGTLESIGGVAGEIVVSEKGNKITIVDLTKVGESKP